MILYLIKSTFCLALLLVVYRLFLEKEKMYRFNRFYLLFSLVFAFSAPFIVIEDYTPIIHNKFSAVITVVEASLTSTYSFSFGVLLGLSYISIAVVLIFRLLRNIWLIISRALNNDRISFNSAELVLLDKNVVSHTFWNYIFIDSDEYFNNTIEKEVLCHELAHARQKHTFDVLLIEFLQAVFWVNPVLIFYRKAIQLNHEFLADEAVVLAYNAPKNYQILLLNKISGNKVVSLSSSFNYQIAKKRLTMLSSDSKSPRQLFFKKLLVIPVVLLSVFLFSSRSSTANDNVGREIQKALDKSGWIPKKGNNAAIELDLEKAGKAPVIELEVPVSVEISPPD